ncbi:hypothetical protein C8J56DRAFT_897023 [Mycena floridula]|nr:hypothetical protein C8J56DRAFT_897023 [Mycena floridula]
MFIRPLDHFPIDFEKKVQENNKGISPMMNKQMSLNNSLGTGLSMMVDADLVFVNLNMTDLADAFKFPKISTSSRIGFLKLTWIAFFSIYSCLTSEEYDALIVSRDGTSVEVKGLDVKHQEYQCALAKSISQPNAVWITNGNHYQTNSINNPDKDTAKTQKINPKVKSNLMYKSCWQ